MKEVYIIIGDVPTRRKELVEELGQALVYGGICQNNDNVMSIYGVNGIRINIGRIMKETSLIKLMRV